MTFDTYSKCSYNCLYCFSFFQKSHTNKGYITGGVRAVNPEKVENLFLAAMANEPEKVTKTERQFFPYIQARRIMQWGGLADEFDEWERRYGITLKLLKFFDKIDYPLSFSTKATWWTQDERYMELFRKHTHNWHVKISIITNSDEKSRKMEKGVPVSSERLAAMKRLTDAGVHVTLRLRPYIIGLGEEWKELIKRAKEAGADSVTTEYFCMESRADDRLKARYKQMSEIVGYDIHEFYMKNSKQNGYKRLNKSIKAPTIEAMRDWAHELGMRFHVSDAFCRECNDACNCCGVPPEFNCSQWGNLGQAIIIAREKGEVHWKDIKEPIEKYLSFLWVDAASYNTGSNRKRAENFKMTMADFLHNNWNNPKGQLSPMKGYGGILIADRIDEDGDVVYRYNRKED
jgi:DNA repair photolyase